MKTNPEARDRALGQVIKALDNPEFPQALAHFARQLIKFDNLIILVYNREQTPVALYREFTDPVVYSFMDSDYIGGAYVLDPFYQAHLNGMKRGVHRIFDLAPDRFKQTSYFEIYYQKTTLIDELTVFAGLGSETTITACFGKDRSSGTLFSRSEQDTLKRHGQTLGALMETYWKDYRPEQPDQGHSKPLIERLKTALSDEHGIQLSPRQTEVAMFILQGHSSLSISLNLDISTETVKVFRRQLYAKCNISSQAELFALIMPVFSRLSRN